ncbi:MAG TPA: GNAT family N-acetyltransferase [Ensifer sp.]|jgi:predicted N-acetyltransferase YhbS|uniref:GNAT family N-acetyltransferase n=1 Tax=Ensifer sp. TaxID=1872086 RepID=UPI002E144FBA|nr:GNAT family N-acetyltransferase [Ensifer sp.]
MQIFRIDQRFDRHDALLALIRDAFASMDGRIDPPSSAHALDIETLRQKVAEEIAFGASDGDRLVGCVFLKPESDCLYVGKLAVAPDAQGKGIGRMLLAEAEATARALELPALRLLTRVELVENHRAFGACGFVQTGTMCHPGFIRPTAIEMRKLL